MTYPLFCYTIFICIHFGTNENKNNNNNTKIKKTTPLSEFRRGPLWRSKIRIKTVINGSAAKTDRFRILLSGVGIVNWFPFRIQRDHRGYIYLGIIICTYIYARKFIENTKNTAGMLAAQIDFPFLRYYRFIQNRLRAAALL